VDLVVDGDDAAEFGPAQYSEADVIAPRIDGTPREQKERDALREAVISPNAPHTPQQLTSDGVVAAQGLVEVKPEPGAGTPIGQQNDADESATSVSPRRDGDTPVMEALRGRIRELEAEMRGQLFKCLICMVSQSMNIKQNANYKCKADRDCLDSCANVRVSESRNKWTTSVPRDHEKTTSMIAL
jgi:hypothetical protein